MPDFFGWLTDLVSGRWWTYWVVFGAAGLDAFFPIVPSETVVITAGLISSDGGLIPPLVALAACAGVLLGDNISYGLGRFAGRRFSDKAFRGDKGRRRLSRARGLVQRHGGPLVLVARFIPGGRTATTFSCGMLGYPWRRFLFFDVIAAVLWALYSTGLGYFGGSVFKESSWKSLAVAFGAALVVFVGLETYRRVQRWRGKESFSFE